jgi:hypothetical protein
MADSYWVNIISKCDIGWIYLLCGLAITVSAIIIPAHQDLQELQIKRAALAEDFEDIDYKRTMFDSFLQEITSGDPVIQQRITELQFNQAGVDEVVVIDNSAVTTPLEWLANKSKRYRVVPIERQQASLLASLASGRTRLVMLGIGVFVLFIGLVKGPVVQRV